jgi:hypothetical protein
MAANFTFVFHMLWDEAHLFNKPTSRLRTLEMLPFLVLWSAIFLHAAYYASFFTEAYVIAGIFIAIRIIMALRSSRRPDVVSYILAGWTFLAFGACVIVESAGMLVPATIWFFGLVTVHFFIWYGDYFRRVASHKDRRTTYVRRTLLTNGVSALIAIAFAVTSAPIFLIFFSVAFANAWSLLHILTSIRFATFRSSFGLTG